MSREPPNDKVIYAEFGSRRSIDPDQVLEQAQGLMDRVIVVGVEKETGIMYLGTSIGDDKGGAAEINWLLDKAKQIIMALGCSSCDCEEEGG